MSLLMSEDSEAGLKCSGWVVATLLCQEIPDRAYEEAAALAGYYSKGKDNDKVEIDYVEKKQVK